MASQGNQSVGRVRSIKHCQIPGRARAFKIRRGRNSWHEFWDTMLPQITLQSLFELCFNLRSIRRQKLSSESEKKKGWNGAIISVFRLAAAFYLYIVWFSHMNFFRTLILNRKGLLTNYRWWGSVDRRRSSSTFIRSWFCFFAFQCSPALLPRIWCKVNPLRFQPFKRQKQQHLIGPRLIALSWWQLRR